MAFDDPLFWTALLKIIGVNAVLSGEGRRRGDRAGMKYLPAIACAALVVAGGRWLTRRHETRHATRRRTASG